jgi:LssY C-terminus
VNRAVPVVARATLVVLAVGVVATVVFTHVVAPMLFTHDDHDAVLSAIPKRTYDRAGHAGDPVNVAVVGTAAEVRAAFARAGWVEADSLSRRADLAIAESVLLRRPDSTAPVSSLYLFRRRQDIAFEREVGRSASRRHHVRLWLVEGVTDHGRPLWVGDATYDLRSGLSSRTLMPTHHIDADVDRERDTLMVDLTRTGQLEERYDVTGLGPRLDAHNASGDRFETDGELAVGVIAPGNVSHGPPVVLPDPAPVRWKNTVWAWLERRFARVP